MMDKSAAFTAQMDQAKASAEAGIAKFKSIYESTLAGAEGDADLALYTSVRKTSATVLQGIQSESDLENAIYNIIGAMFILIQKMEEKA